jgi:hypothetical protein
MVLLLPGLCFNPPATATVLSTAAASPSRHGGRPTCPQQGPRSTWRALRQERWQHYSAQHTLSLTIMLPRPTAASTCLMASLCLVASLWAPLLPPST